MAYNHGREDRKWRIWKEAEEKLLRECGVDEATIEQIRMADRADFNSNRRFYRWTNDVAEYLEDIHQTYEAAALRLRSCRKRSLPLPCVCEVLYGCRKLHCAIPYYKTSEKHTVCKTPCY